MVCADGASSHHTTVRAAGRRGSFREPEQDCIVARISDRLSYTVCVLVALHCCLVASRCQACIAVPPALSFPLNRSARARCRFAVPITRPTCAIREVCVDCWRKRCAIVPLHMVLCDARVSLLRARFRALDHLQDCCTHCVVIGLILVHLITSTTPTYDNCTLPHLWQRCACP
jgi:hypothetical protein